MTPYEFGDVLLLGAYPFSNLGEVKKRPALVLADTEDQDVILCRITSEPSRDSFDVDLRDWKEAGLLLPSCARISKIATLSRRLVIRKLGRLGSPTRRKVREALRKLLLI